MENNDIYPEGRVKIYNKKTSELLLDSHNMILKFGRDYIRDLFLANVTYLGMSEKMANVSGNSDIGNNKFYSLPATLISGTGNWETWFKTARYCFYSIVFGNDGSGTIKDGDYSELLGSSEENSRKVDEILFSEVNSTDYQYDGSTLTIRMTLQHQSKNVIARELGIVLTNYDETVTGFVGSDGTGGGDKKLFSRISFDPISIESDSELVLEYILHF